jgi:hypothetical protein
MESYFSPTNIQPYHLMKCAEWMTSVGYFSNKADAFRYLCFLSENNTPKLLNYFDKYTEATKIITGYVNVCKTDKLSFISSSGPYGEPHMNYAKL